MPSNHKVEVEKKTKYTLKEGNEFISMKTNGEKADAFVPHILGNNITNETPEHCLEKLNKLCAKIQKNSIDSKVYRIYGSTTCR